MDIITRALMRHMRKGPRAENIANLQEETGRMIYNIHYKSPMSPADEELYEATKQKVANMLELEEWHWLKTKISDQKLSWPDIMQEVAAHI